MSLERRSAVLVGVLYIVASAAGLIGLGVFEDPTLGAADYLVKVSENETQILIGALCEMVMAVSVTGIALAVYPILKKRSSSIAVGYVGARIAEAMIYILGIISLLTLLTLSRQFVEAGAPDGSPLQTIGDLLLARRDWGGHVVLDVAVFPLGAFLFYFLLYRSRLVPRWISGLGLIAAPFYWSAGLLVMFDTITPLSTTHVLLQAPLGVQELFLALWLIFKGFNQTATDSSSVL